MKDDIIGWERKNKGNRFISRIVEEIQEVQKSKSEYSISCPANNVFDVVRGDSTNTVQLNRVTDKNRHPCTCMAWRDQARPCKHGILVLQAISGLDYNLFDKRYLSSTYKGVLELNIELIDDSKLSAGDDLILGIDGSPCLIDTSSSIRSRKTKERRKRSAVEKAMKKTRKTEKVAKKVKKQQQ